MSFIGSVWDELHNGKPPWMGFDEDGNYVNQRRLTEEEYEELKAELPTDEDVNELMAEVFGQEGQR